MRTAAGLPNGIAPPPPRPAPGLPPLLRTRPPPPPRPPAHKPPPRPDPGTPPKDRIAQLLGDATKASRILEIGPSHAPIAPKRQGWNSFVVDHADQHALRRKYAALGANADAIEPVDAIWTGGRLDQAVPAEHHGSFDRLIASHVIEHIPDPVAFLVAAQALLAPGGAVALAVPDKRYCFDFLKPHATTGDLLAAHDPNGPGRHTARTLFNQAAHSAFARAEGSEFNGAWGQHPVAQIRLTDPLPRAFTMAGKAAEPTYHDAHGWQFTPCAFELAIVELAEGGVIDWHVADITPARGSEFFAILRRGRRAWATPEARDAHRQQLLLGIMAELREQIDFMALGGLLDRPSLPADPTLACHLHDLQSTLAALPGTLADVAMRLEAAQRQLSSITDADGTQASIMGSLEQLRARTDAQQALLDGLAHQLDAQNRMLATLTAPDGTQASIMGSLELLVAQQRHHQQAIADTSSQAISAGTQAIEAGRLLHVVCGRLDEQQGLIRDQGRALDEQRRTLAEQRAVLDAQAGALARVDDVSGGVGRLLGPLVRLRARLFRRHADD